MCFATGIQRGPGFYPYHVTPLLVSLTLTNGFERFKVKKEWVLTYCSFRKLLRIINSPTGDSGK